MNEPTAPQHNSSQEDDENSARDFGVESRNAAPSEFSVPAIGLAALNAESTMADTDRNLISPETKSLAKRYVAFDRAFGPISGTVYYPACATDVAPSVAFAEKDDVHVIYADIDSGSITKLQSAGYDAHEVDAKTFQVSPNEPSVDLLILLNPAISSEGPTAQVKSGGYALVNNYHGTANDLHKDPRFELLGIISDDAEGGDAIVDTEHPEQHWEAVENDEQFRNSSEYKGICMMVQMATNEDTRDLSLAKYGELIAGVRSANPSALEDDGYLFWFEGGTQHIMPTTLPRKKGGMDDTYVFRRH
jgi:hypothetical protein